VAYLEGNGTQPNITEGINWLRRAANAGDPKAHYDLALAYFEGEGVRQNDARGKKWLDRAAKQGQGKASRRLEILNSKRRHKGTNLNS